MQTKKSFLLCGIVLLIKIFAVYNTNFDLFGDEAQYWIWSKSPDLGYYSKPPLLAWLITFITLIFGDSFETLKLISVSMYVFTSIAVYLIFKQLYQDKKEAILAGLTFYLVPAVTVSSFLISTDILLIFFWSISLYFLLKIRKEPSIINFVLLGIFVGLSFLSKYAAVYFILSIIFILLPLFISNIKEVKNIIFFLTIFLIVYLFSYLQNPILFNEFINHLIYGRSDNFTKIFGEGFGLFSLINFLSDNLFQSIQLKSDLIKNFLWLSICSLIFLYSFLITTEKQNKDLFSKNIAFGICVLTFCYPILKHYECFLVVPSIFFLINSSKMNIKFLLLILMFGFHDKHTLILVLTSTLMLEFYFNKKIPII